MAGTVGTGVSRAGKAAKGARAAVRAPGEPEPPAAVPAPAIKTRRLKTSLGP